MVQEHAIGHIADITEEGLAVIHAALPNLKHAIDRRYGDVEIILPDGRRITPQQRRKVYALLGEVAEYVDGIRNTETMEDAKNVLKWDFALQRMESQERRLFSLANVDETTAREFIDYIVGFIVSHGIPTKISLIENCEDISRYVYANALAKRCAICGKPADLHHVDAVGMGNDREEICHIGREALPLCRVHHTELHSMGNSRFMEKYHLESVKIDQAIAKKYKLNRRVTGDATKSK